MKNNNEEWFKVEEDWINTHNHLREKLKVASRQLEGVALLLEEHGQNINVPFLIKHYRECSQRLLNDEIVNPATISTYIPTANSTETVLSETSNPKLLKKSED